MKIVSAAFAASSLLGALAGSAALPTVASAQPVATTYVACNSYGDCWRVHDIYAYGLTAPITYYNSDWYEAHRADAHVHWLADPDNDRGYYDREGHWRPDPAARAVKGGAVGAGLGAAIGCLVTLPIGCAPGAATGAAVGAGAGAVTGAATTPPR